MPESAITDELRYLLLKEISDNPDISQRQLAKVMGVSLGKTNYCLKALVEAGWVKVGNFARSTHKLNYAYVLTPKGIKEKSAVTVRFLKKKQLQYEELKTEIERLQKEVHSVKEKQ